MSFQSIVNFFMPKEDKFYTILEQQAVMLHQAAEALELFAHSANNSTVSFSVQEIEHDGDKLVSLMEEELAKTFITPLDREDIHKLSIEMDDVIDFCNQAARSCVLFSVNQPTPAMSHLMSNLVKCTKHLSEVLPSLRKADFKEFYRVKGAIKELEKDSDKIYRAEISRLFQDSIDSDRIRPDFFSQKEVLDKLENAVDRCEDITQFLVNLAVKNG